MRLEFSKKSTYFAANFLSRIIMAKPQYRTNDGMTFNSRFSAEQHEKLLEADRAFIIEAADDMEQELRNNDPLLKPFYEALNLRSNSIFYMERNDWKMVIRAYASMIELIGSPIWNSDVQKVIEQSSNPDKWKKISELLKRELPYYKVELATAYSNLGSAKFDDNNIDGAIGDMRAALAIYPFNDQVRKKFEALLGTYFAASGDIHSNNEDWDRAIINYCVAIKLKPSLIYDKRNKLAFAFFERSTINSGKCVDYENKELGKIAVNDANAVIKLSYDAGYANLNAKAWQIREAIVKKWEEFDDMPDYEEPEVLKIMDELSKNAAANAPRTIAITEEAPEPQEEEEIPLDEVTIPHDSIIKSPAPRNKFYVGDAVFAGKNSKEYYFARIVFAKNDRIANVKFYDGTTKENAQVFLFKEIVKTHYVSGNSWNWKTGACKILDVSDTHVEVKHLKTNITDILPLDHIMFTTYKQSGHKPLPSDSDSRDKRLIALIVIVAVILIIGCVFIFTK